MFSYYLVFCSAEKENESMFFQLNLPHEGSNFFLFIYFFSQGQQSYKSGLYFCLQARTAKTI